MKLNTIIYICLPLALLAGCSENMQKSQDTHSLNSGLIEAYGNISINNSIISQHTLYPYHFVSNSVKLNELGDNDLQVLIKHFTDNPGKLNVRQGEVADELYQGRIEFVLAKITDAGIDRKEINVSDDMPGGSGISSEKVIVILAKENKGD